MGGWASRDVMNEREHGDWVRYEEITKHTMTDEEIAAIYKRIFESTPGASRSAPTPAPLVIAFGHAVAAASGPNAALVAALKKIERNEQVVFDEDTDGDVIVSMDTDDMIEVARAALAAVGVEP